MNSPNQLDTKRIQSLTDATFAVAMTILILEIHIPDNLTSSGLIAYILDQTLSEFIVYIVSFIILGVFWIGTHFHHHLITHTDRISSWLNIIFLLFICMIPFSAKLLGNYRNERLSIIFYSANLIIASSLHYLMLLYAWKKNYIKPHFTHAFYQNARLRILIPIFIYVGVIIVSFFSVNIAIWFFLVPVLLHIFPESGNKNIK